MIFHCLKILRCLKISRFMYILGPYIECLKILQCLKISRNRPKLVVLKLWNEFGFRLGSGLGWVQFESGLPQETQTYSAYISLCLNPIPQFEKAWPKTNPCVPRELLQDMNGRPPSLTVEVHTQYRYRLHLGKHFRLLILTEGYTHNIPFYSMRC